MRSSARAFAPVTAVVQQDVCRLLLELLTAYGEPMRHALLEAGVSEALRSGIADGWMPRGAVSAALALQQRLVGSQANRGQQQHGGTPRSSQSGAPPPGARAASQQ